MKCCVSRDMISRIEGGYVHGTSDEIGQHITKKPVTMQDCNATIGQPMGMDLKHVEHSSSGRSFTVADNGVQLPEVFA